MKTLNKSGNKRAKKRIDACALFIIYIMVPYTFILAIQVNPIIYILNRFLLVLLFLNCLFRIIKYGFAYRIDTIGLLFLSSMIYMFTSIVLSSVGKGYSSEVIFREMFYMVLPIFMFYIKKEEEKRHKKSNFYELFVLLVAFIVIIGIPIFFSKIQMPFSGSQFDHIRTNSVSFGFGSFIGVIGLGYLSQLCFAISLFKLYKSKIPSILNILFFFLAAILTFQRSPILGMIIATLLYLICTSKDICSFIKALFIMIGLLLLSYLLLYGFDQLTELSIPEFIKSQLKQFDVNEVIVNRSNQFIIYNRGFLQYLFGQGIGTYSPNNPSAIQSLSDAGFYRIINEQGFIGLLLFIAPLGLFIIKVFRKKNHFGIYFIIFSIISFYFNRTIWSIPSAYIFYSILGIEYYKSIKISKYEKQ